MSRRATWSILAGGALLFASMYGCVEHTRYTVRPNNHLLPGVTSFLVTVKDGVDISPHVRVFSSAEACEARAEQLNATRPELFLCVPISGVRMT